MRQIEYNMLSAIEHGRNWKESNTQVQVREDGSTWVYLHGNMIAVRDRYNIWLFTLAGWNTPTTRSRLRALGVDIRQRGGIPYYNGKPIDIRASYCAN